MTYYQVSRLNKDGEWVLIYTGFDYHKAIEAEQSLSDKYPELWVNDPVPEGGWIHSMFDSCDCCWTRHLVVVDENDK